MKRLAHEVIEEWRKKVGAPAQPTDLISLKARIEAWFSLVAVARQHLIPCAILPYPAATFSVGAIRFMHVRAFDPVEFGVPVGSDPDIYFGTLFTSMRERAAGWIAVSSGSV